MIDTWQCIIHLGCDMTLTFVLTGGRFEWRLDEVEKADGTAEDQYLLPSPLYLMVKSQVFAAPLPKRLFHFLGSQFVS